MQWKFVTKTKPSFCLYERSIMGKPHELMRILVNFIKHQVELIKHENINQSVVQTLDRCFYYCMNTSDQNHDLKLFEIDSVLDFLHDELNTGHWSNVPICVRRCFSSASFIKCILSLKCSDTYSVELLQKCLKCLDLGLLLGAPLEDNCDLLTIAARYLTEEINKTLNITCNFGSRSVSAKRKIDDEQKCKYEKLNGKEVYCKDCPSLEYFNKNYFTLQIPVKLRGCMDHWPATKKWLDINYLLNIAGDRTVPVEIGSHYVDENWTQKLMTLREFITNHYLGKSDDVGYLAQHNLFEQIPELKKDIRIPDYCCLSLDYENASEPDINAWFGPKGTISPLHHDPKNNILAQVYGTKQLVLFSPQDSPYLYAHEGSLLFNTAKVNPVKPDLKKYPEFPNSTMYKCLLEPGEMLFIPEKWWHHVSALDKSFSVSFWWQ